MVSQCFLIKHVIKYERDKKFCESENFLSKSGFKNVLENDLSNLTSF